MQLNNVTKGCVYRFHANGGKEYELVRATRYGGGGWVTVKGPTNKHVPYNYARPDDLRRPSRLELQQFLAQMP